MGCVFVPTSTKMDCRRMLVGSTLSMAGLKTRSRDQTRELSPILVVGMSTSCGECRRNYIDNLQVPGSNPGRASAR
jgi:hypothetical protein